MSKLLKLRLGVSDDPSALQPSLSDCLQAMVEQADPLMTEVVNGLMLGVAPNGPRRILSLQTQALKLAVQGLYANTRPVADAFRAELSRLLYEGGGKDIVQTEALRFEDLQLFGAAELDHSIEIARAQQEVQLAVDDVLPALDALVSTLMGWRTIQPGLNPLRPETYVRALQAVLVRHVPDAVVRDGLIVPAAGLLGANLRRLYREMTDWLVSTGIEPAVPVGGRLAKGSGAAGSPVTNTVARTLLTLDRLRKLLAGDFHKPSNRPEFLQTMPASMAMLQDMQQVDQLVHKLEQRAPPPPPEQPEDMLAEAPLDAGDKPPADAPKLGLLLGEQVVRLMFENLSRDSRLTTAYRQRLSAMEPAVLRLAQADSRFFSDRNHPARQLLDRLTQRSLAFNNESDEGWHRFLATVDAAVRWLVDSKVVDADTFGELLEHLERTWETEDRELTQRRAEAARALVHAEQRNLLAQRLAAEFADQLQGLQVPPFVGDFLRTAWAQVIAETRLTVADGSDDPHGYRAVADDLIWSVQSTTALRGRLQRLVLMIPGLLTRLREGLQRIDYPEMLTARFFENLVTIHHAALQEGRDQAALNAAAAAAEAQPSEFTDSAFEIAQMWLAGHEASEAAYLADPPEPAATLAPAAPAPSTPAMAPPGAPGDGPVPATGAAPGAAPDDEPAAAPAAEAVSGELRTGTWVELQVGAQWLRVQLTWASPHHTLFMFTSPSGTAHSMSRRTLDKLRAQGAVRVVAQRHLIDDALDQVAQAALRNSVGARG